MGLEGGGLLTDGVVGVEETVEGTVDSSLKKRVVVHVIVTVADEGESGFTETPPRRAKKRKRKQRMDFILSVLIVSVLTREKK